MGWQKFRELVLMVDIRHFQVWSYLQSVKHWRHYTFTLVDKNDLITCWKWGLKLSGGAVCGDWHDICFGSLSTRPKLSEHLWITLAASQLWWWNWGLKLCVVGGSSVGGGWSLLWPRGECRHSYTFSFPPSPLCSLLLQHLQNPLLHISIPTHQDWVVLVHSYSLFRLLRPRFTNS